MASGSTAVSSKSRIINGQLYSLLSRRRMFYLSVSTVASLPLPKDSKSQSRLPSEICKHILIFAHYVLRVGFASSRIATC